MSNQQFSVLVPRLVGLADGGPALPPLFKGCQTLLRDIGGEDTGAFNLTNFEPVPLRRAGDPDNWTRGQGAARILVKGREPYADRRLLWLFSQSDIPADWRRWWIISATLWPNDYDKPCSRRWSWGDGSQCWIQYCKLMSRRADDDEAFLCRKVEVE